MVSLSGLSAVLQDLFTTGAAEAARVSGCVRRERQFTGASLCQTLVFGWLERPAASLSELCAVAADCGATITPQGLAGRFTEDCAAMLEHLVASALAVVIAADPVAIPLFRRFPAVLLQDTTVITLPAALADRWPGCGNGAQSGESAAVKLGVRLDLLTGAMDGPVVVPARTHDRSTTDAFGPLPVGTLRLRDLGFFSLKELAAAQEAGTAWLTRVQAGTALFDGAGQRHQVSTFLTAQQTDRVDCAITLGVVDRLPCRLLAVRVPPEVAGRREARLRKEADRRQSQLSPEALRLAHWTILVTNLAPAMLSLEEALVLARARWQIELLFKLWKSGGQIDTWRSAAPWRILCELYAKLLAMLVQHWLLLTGCWQEPRRSLPKATAAIRRAVPQLLAALSSHRRLRGVLLQLQEALGGTTCQNPRRAKPNAYQLWLDPSLIAVS